MDKKALSVELQMDGSVLTMPAKLALGYQKEELLVHGSVKTAQANPAKILRNISEEAARKLCAVIEKMADCLPEELTFQYAKGQGVLWATGKNSIFGIVWEEQMFACLVGVQINPHAASGTLENYIAQAAKLFCVDQIYLYGKKGNKAALPLLTRTVFGKKEEFCYPKQMEEYEFLFCGKFSYNKDRDLVGKFLYEAFGIEPIRITLFMGMKDDEFAGYAMLPVKAGSVLQAEELYLGVECGKQMTMVLSGSFRFSFLDGAVFHVSANINKEGFMLEAFAQPEEPLTIYKNFKIGDTALAIGVSADEMIFRMFCNLYIGEIKAFGAVGVLVTQSAAFMEFLSAAITDITLPVLIKNIFGTNVAFADALDFLSLSGLPLQGVENAKIIIEKGADVKDDTVKEQVVDQFNRLLSSESFRLSSSTINLERAAGAAGGDVILTDKSRMRHYFINSGGRLSLQAQFYYSVVDVRFGDYTLKKGIFLCGCITLFKKFSVKALFSMSEDDGLLAYAGIDSMNLGVIEIGPSGIVSADNPLSHFPKDSILWLLMDQNPEAKPKGAVFFLRAGKRECNFYIDGKIKLFNIFEFTAQIFYANKTVSIDTRFRIGSRIQILFQVKASYGNFTDMDFSVVLTIDCTGLEKALQGAQRSIEQAIAKLREKINKAKDQLTQAQRNVNELHSQIDVLNNKISNCRSAIRNANKFVKAFVAIAKGIEIAAYEVAIAGLYVAIGVANAALEVAKAAVSIAGAVGEGVLAAVNAAISATLNLFFVKYIQLCAAANKNGGCFEAKIEFVALGKTFKIEKKIEAGNFLKNPDKVLDNSISDRLQPELNNIENGSFKSNRRRYKKMQCSMREYQKMYGQGINQIESGTALLKGMAEAYMEQCGEMLPEYEHFNESYAYALGEVESVLAISDDSVDFRKMDHVAEAVREAMQDETNHLKEEKHQQLESVMKDYEAAVRLADKMKAGRDTVFAHKQDMHAHLEQMKETEIERLNRTARRATVSDKSMEKMLNDTEELLYQQFPPTRSRGDYINLSRESKVLESIDEMRNQMGLAQSENVKKNRGKRTPLKYTERL